MNQEITPTNLKKAITRLSAYEPPNEIWSAIENELNLQKGVQALPTHEPKPFVWQTIEENLVKGTSESVSRTWRFGSTNRIVWLKRLSLAASFLLLIGVGWWGINKTTNTQQLQYSQETINTQLLIADWDEDAEVLTQIEAICQTKNYACTVPEFQQLEEELEELDEAKSDLKQAIDNFGKDTQLIAKLSEVELERTVILKKMIANIL